MFLLTPPGGPGKVNKDLGVSGAPGLCRVERGILKTARDTPEAGSRGKRILQIGFMASVTSSIKWEPQGAGAPDTVNSK